MNFFKLLTIVSLAITSVSSAPNKMDNDMSVQIQEMIQNRKMYALKNIVEMEKQITEHKAGRRRLDALEYENVVENLSKHKKSLDRIALVEEKEMERYARGLRR